MPQVPISIEMRALKHCSKGATIESFRFGVRKTMSTRFYLEFFMHSQKMDTMESFVVLFFIRKVSTVIHIKGG